MGFMVMLRFSKHFWEMLKCAIVKNLIEINQEYCSIACISLVPIPLFWYSGLTINRPIYAVPFSMYQEPGQINTVAKTLYNSGILKRGEDDGTK